jgi:hypothetical protein
MATCQELRAQLATKQNEEILLKADADIKSVAATMALNAAQLAQMKLSQNRGEQLALHGQMNAQGC